MAAGTRKGRTGLEWLLEKEPPANAENGSAGDAVPEAPVAPASGSGADVDAALAFLDQVPQPIASTVESKPPADAAFSIDEEPTPPPRGDVKRGLDAVANALLQADPPPKPEEEPATSEAATADVAAAADVEVVADAAEPEAPAKAEPSPETPIADPLAAVTEKHRKAVSSGRSTRAHPRAHAVFEAKFKKASDSVVGRGRNVSRGGFFVETTKTLPDGEVFQAQLLFPERKLSVIAEVMWSWAGDPENPERFPPGMGCKFLDIDERDTPFLQGVIDASLARGGEVP